MELEQLKTAIREISDDDDLDEVRRFTLAEQERRAALETIPGQIQELTEKYVAGGGNPDDLKNLD